MRSVCKNKCIILSTSAKASTVCSVFGREAGSWSWEMCYDRMRFICFLCMLIALCQSGRAQERELRGVWIASVLNIDWPSSIFQDEKKQKEDFKTILEFYKKLNFNAVFVQVRTAGDALYQSEIAPWSRFLTSKEGTPSMYDPLPWMIEQAHAQNMQFHAWLNPYRASTDLDTTLFHSTHVFNQHRDWIIKYGPKYYLDPGRKEVQNHVCAVVNEVIQKYEVDGIHFDDYFYPYKVEGESFDDSDTYEKFGVSSFEDIETWRRSNVDSLVKNVRRVIKSHSEEIIFGISPFGVWRNRTENKAGSRTHARQTTFDDLYADPLVWCKNGWVDYINPQIYWSRSFKPVKFKRLLRWWDKAVDIPIFVGLGAYKVLNDADEAWNDIKELSKQIRFSRKRQDVKGFVLFSSRSLTDKAFLVHHLREGPLRESVELPNLTEFKE